MLSLGNTIFETCNRMAKPKCYWDGICESGSKCEVTDTRSAGKITLLPFYEGSPLFRSDAGSGEISVRWSIFFGADMVWIASRFRKGSEETDLNDKTQYLPTLPNLYSRPQDFLPQRYQPHIYLP